MNALNDGKKSEAWLPPKPRSLGWSGLSDEELKRLAPGRKHRRRAVMISIDANLLFHAYNVDSPHHQEAYDWIVSISGDENVVLSEFILAELYCLFRNPIVAKNGALSPGDAVALIESYRRHPRWMLAGFSANGRHVHDSLWNYARKPEFAFRKLYDVRTALISREHGVTDFATINLRDFEGLGFRRVWNPGVE